MTGIHDIIDEKGRKSAAVIDLRKHGKLWEDFHDLLVSHSRSSEIRIPLSKVKDRLVANGQLSA
jgi:hypothetical protein